MTIFYCLMNLGVMQVIWTCLSESELRSKLCYNGRSVSQSVLVSSPIWDPRLDFCYCQTVAVLLIWGALSDKRTCLSFTIAAGLCQHSYSWLRVPQNCLMTFKVMELAWSISWVNCCWSYQAQSFLVVSPAGLMTIFYCLMTLGVPQLILTRLSKLCYNGWSIGQSVLVSRSICGPRSDFCYCQTVAVLLMWGALSDKRMGLLFTIVAGLHQCSHSIN
jgi:hypothetical protein